MNPVPGSEFQDRCRAGAAGHGLRAPGAWRAWSQDLGLALDQRGNVRASTDDYLTSIDKVFAAGDVRRGQSLVVWAIREGRQAAHAVDKFLMGSTPLPR